MEWLHHFLCTGALPYSVRETVAQPPTNVEILASNRTMDSSSRFRENAWSVGQSLLHCINLNIFHTMIFLKRLWRKETMRRGAAGASSAGKPACLQTELRFGERERETSHL